MAKTHLKQKAVRLRKQGLTYSEILGQVPVAKSTLSLWLREVGLAKAQKQRITKKRRDAQKRGAKRKREQRLEKTEKIFEEARKDIGRISKRDIWLMGVMLYWAEGSKQKEHSVSPGMDFANSDPRMIKFFLYWLEEVFEIGKDKVALSLFIHENSRKRIHKVLEYWAKQIGVPKESFGYIYFKKHNPKTKRKNTGEKYFGLVSVRVRASTDLNRKVAGWVEGVNQEVWGNKK